LFKIAEVDILRIPLSDESFQQLVYVMVVERTRNCSKLICFKAGNNVLLTINKHLVVLIQQKKNLILENNVFKCVDYRTISRRIFDHPIHRRGPAVYSISDLRNLDHVVDWSFDNNDDDRRLQIICYDAVCVGHFRKHLRPKNI
jgi:hypothetical protein